MDGISFNPIDIMSVIDKVGTLGVLLFFGVKVVYNDLKHIQDGQDRIERLTRVMVRLLAEHVGKNPDVIEAQMEADTKTE
jgi:hypothetical protein